MATSQIETVSSGADKAKIGAALLLALAGFVAYFLLSSQAGYIRWAALFMSSAAGKGFWAFVQDSERELRKVVWPTRKETWQISLFVCAFAVLMSLFLWLVDKGLEWVLYSLILGWR